MDKNDLVKSLNEALQLEYTDIFLYPRQADIVKEKEISQMFEKFGRMELRHADNIAMQINALGGKPVWEFSMLDAKESLDEILDDHLENESKAIALYNELIEAADREGEDELKLILKGIRAEEEHHFKKIKEILVKIKK